MERLVLDSSAWIEVERQPSRLGDLVPTGCEVFLPAMVLAELKAGVESSKMTDEQRQRSRVFVHKLELAAEFVPVDQGVVERFVNLQAHCRLTGKPRGTADLLIAATALALDATLVTFDQRARFAQLPNLRVRG